MTLRHWLVMGHTEGNDARLFFCLADDEYDAVAMFTHWMQQEYGALGEDELVLTTIIGSERLMQVASTCWQTNGIFAQTSRSA